MSPMHALLARMVHHLSEAQKRLAPDAAANHALCLRQFPVNSWAIIIRSHHGSGCLTSRKSETVSRRYCDLHSRMACPKLPFMLGSSRLSDLSLAASSLSGGLALGLSLSANAAKAEGGAVISNPCLGLPMLRWAVSVGCSLNGGS